MTTDDKPNPRVLRILKCQSHGDRVWKGHVICDACGRVYQTESAYRPRPVPASEMCLCGRRLMPKDPVGDALGMVSSHPEGEPAVAIPTSDASSPVPLAKYADDSTARPICYLCFRIIDRRGGRMPNWITKEPLPS